MRVQESILALEQRRGNTVIVCDRAVGRVLLGYFLGTQPDRLPFLEMFPGVVELRCGRPKAAQSWTARAPLREDGKSLPPSNHWSYTSASGNALAMFGAGSVLARAPPRSCE